MRAQWKKYRLHFYQPAGTSRGTLRYKDSYFIKIEHEARVGWGECGLLRGLSADDRPDYEATLRWLNQNIHRPFEELYPELREFPSIQFGLEMALRDLEVKNHQLFDTSFCRGEAGQPINGLIWMDSPEGMRKQIRKKLGEGFGVLKLKIGALAWPEEKRLLEELRQEFSAAEVELRVDANGAFSLEEAPAVLEVLARLKVHSIEQPIRAGQWQEMAALCESSPLPIALDEDLIGLFDRAQRESLLRTVRPQFIILKPSFVGGWRGSDEWRQLASDYNAGWWATSALESNLGLNAIAQWNSTTGNTLPSGLGTGRLYRNNIPAPLEIRDGCIHFGSQKGWEIEETLGGGGWL